MTRAQPTRRLGPLTALLLVAQGASAEAASLSVAPTRVDLVPGATAAMVTLQNDAELPVTVQVQTFGWRRSTASQDLEATRDLLAVPPVFSLAPKGKQIIRVALRGEVAGGSDAQERAYRLLITEVPELATATGAGVRFALRLSLPVFVTPAGAQALPSWSMRPGGSGAELELANKGTAHLQVRRIELRAATDQEPVQVIEVPAYVLPGQTQAWPLAAATRKHRRLRLQADTDLGPIEADLVVPPG